MKSHQIVAMAELFEKLNLELEKSRKKQEFKGMSAEDIQRLTILLCEANAFLEIYIDEEK